MMKKNIRVLGAVLAVAGILSLIIVVALVNNKSSVTNTTTPNSEENEVRVQITKDGFDPALLGIKQGTKVTWTNDDTAPHSVASNPHPEHTALSGLDSKEPLGSSATYSYTFNEPGTFSYHDHLNPTMNATIIVTE